METNHQRKANQDSRLEKKRVTVIFRTYKRVMHVSYVSMLPLHTRIQRFKNKQHDEKIRHKRPQMLRFLFENEE
jgi:hypothetical protein